MSNYLYRKGDVVLLSTNPAHQGTVTQDQASATDWIRVKWDRGNENNVKQGEIILLSVWEWVHGKRATR